MEGKTVKDLLIDLAEARLQALERKGNLLKGKMGITRVTRIGPK